MKASRPSAGLEQVAVAVALAAGDQIDAAFRVGAVGLARFRAGPNACGLELVDVLGAVGVVGIERVLGLEVEAAVVEQVAGLLVGGGPGGDG